MYDMKPYLKKIEETIKAGPYEDTWDSLQHYSVPEWFRNAKFGIFVHWGVYCVPEYGSEWYSRNMYIEDSPEYRYHLEHYGKHREFGYKDLIPMFTGEKFDPDQWCDLFKESGAGYVVPVAEHHDGFQMYQSEISHWNAAEMGPCKDVLGEVAQAAERHDLILGTSSHRIEHWFFMGNGKKFDSDVKEPLERGDFYWPAMPEPDFKDLFSTPSPSQEFMEDWLCRTCEIIDKYQPRILYFDWWIQHSAAKPYLKKLAAYYYNSAARRGEEVVICYKHDAFMFGSAVVEIERGQFADAKPYYWQTDTSVALNSWCYTKNNVYKTAEELVCDLIDIVSKNGNLLLNVGPKKDGTIPEKDAEILRGIGNWLRINGEAVYGSSVWRESGEGPTKIVEGQFSDGERKEFTSQDIRYTVNGGSLYGTVLKCSEDGSYMFRELGKRDAWNKAYFHGIIKTVSVLGFEEQPKWYRDSEGLHVQIEKVKSSYPIVFKIEID